MRPHLPMFLSASSAKNSKEHDFEHIAGKLSTRLAGALSLTTTLMTQLYSGVCFCKVLSEFIHDYLGISKKR